MSRSTAVRARVPITPEVFQGETPIPAPVVERRTTTRHRQYRRAGATNPQPESRRRRALVAARRILATSARLGFGIALMVSGVAITGGSFGLFAFIGIPLLAVGLGLITMDNPTDSRR